MNSSNETVIKCIGCENECEVSIAFQGGQYVCLGGNNCPTGESYALSQVVKANELSTQSSPGNIGKEEP